MRRVLIVEDNDAIRESLCEALVDEGYEVATAADAERALEAAKSAEPAVVLLDLVLPGLEGGEIARRLRAAGCRAPVVVLSADRAGVRRAREAGAVAFLPKPFDLAELLGIVERLVPREPDARAQPGDAG